MASQPNSQPNENFCITSYIVLDHLKNSQNVSHQMRAKAVHKRIPTTSNTKLTAPNGIIRLPNDV